MGLEHGPNCFCQRTEKYQSHLIEKRKESRISQNPLSSKKRINKWKWRRNESINIHIFNKRYKMNTGNAPFTFLQCYFYCIIIKTKCTSNSTTHSLDPIPSGTQSWNIFTKILHKYKTKLSTQWMIKQYLSMILLWTLSTLEKKRQ